MKTKRIISALLAVLMLMGTMTLVIGAEGTETETETREYQYRTDSTTSLMAPNPDLEKEQGSTTLPNSDRYLYQTGQYLKDGVLTTVTTAEEKLSLMDYRYGNDQYGLYVDAYSGEVAVVCWKTGEALFSNPYNMSEAGASVSANSTVLENILSQLVVNFTNLDTSSNETYYSYIEATERNQITVKNIKGGLRVEYSIGREATKSLVPRQISKETFEKKILSKLQEKLPEWNKNNSEDQALYKKFFANFQLIDPNASDVSETNRKNMLNQYPITEEMPIYVLLSDVKDAQVAWLEQQIKLYCPDYSFSDLEADHAEVGYEGTSEVYPLFKMALEYTLDEDGLIVRLPANGIRFDESRYQLNYIEVLPYMGAGSDPNPGYTFFPDGSGALFDFQELEATGSAQSVTGKIYGQDYAYHEVEGKYEEVIRYPVFGLVESQSTEVGGATVTKDRGFVAIVEEGDSLMELTSYHAGPSSSYHTVRMKVYPRPTDSYILADSISVASNDPITVVSSRKYTESYQVRYIMLNDGQYEEELGNDYLECSYAGMAKAYRNYLEKNSILTKLTASDVKNDIPLYVETFGAVLSTKKVLSIPFNVTVPLTSFDNVATMYDELSNKGITNINFILTGYTDGGLEAESMPYRLKWDSAVKDEMDFEDLLAYAVEKGFGLFPDFDFVFSSTNTLFDGLSLSKHAVKTIDDRYTSKREYSATKHTYISYYEMAISPAYFSHFYEKFMPKYTESNPIGISVSTLGSYLNSDFDEDEPYHRADSQAFTVAALQYIQEAMNGGEVLTSGGNAYTWKYVDHLKDIAIDSSRYVIASASVPFLGMVLHGYVEFAGTAINMEGNLSYAFLKSLESGASLNFLLSYQNTETLKENEATSQYYSIRYDIWFDDLISMYTELNSLLKDVQTSAIVSHKFIGIDSATDADYAVRVPDADELESDALQAIQNAIAQNKADKEAAAEAIRQGILAARKEIAGLKASLDSGWQSFNSKNLNNVTTKITTLTTSLNPTAPATIDQEKVLSNLNNVYKEIRTAHTALQALLAQYDSAQEALSYLTDEVDDFDAGLLAHLNTLMADPELAQLLSEIQAAVTDLNQKATEAYNSVTAKGITAKTYEQYIQENTAAQTTSGSGEPTSVTPVTGTQTTTGSSITASQTVSQYRADKNTVVYEKYENGTEFLMNFNDYKVLVYFNGTTYTIDAYGYIILNRGA